MITRLRELGKTILLTTHYMEAAQALADRIIVVVAGRVVAEGTPDSLGGRDLAPATVRLRLPAGVGLGRLPEFHGRRFRADRDHIELAGAEQADLGVLLDWAREHKFQLADLTVARPSLEDVYLEFTGGVR